MTKHDSIYLQWSIGNPKNPNGKNFLLQHNFWFVAGNSFGWWISIIFEVCQSFWKFWEILLYMTFWFQVPLSFFWLTKEKKLVWQSSKEAPFVCRLMLVIVQSFCSLSPTSHHFEMIWKGLKTRKSKKMCLSSYSLMAVVETQQAVARPGSDWSSSVSARLWLV